jgi:uncharacterized protein
MLNHSCNLRCSYCYVGCKISRPMSLSIAGVALRRAFRSVAPGGTVELAFFGGEPLLEHRLLRQILDQAAHESRATGISLNAFVTTNGTVSTGDAWELLLCPELRISISFDGTPQVHDLHRRYVDGRPSWRDVLRTMARLQDAEKPFDVVMVVRPDTAAEMAAGLRFLRSQGVRMVIPTLDVWAFWRPEDLDRLEESLVASAQVWQEGLPDFGVAWFNEKLVETADVPVTKSARCGFGFGEVAVTPQGHLYPCERLIGEDRHDHPMRLPGDVFDGADFLSLKRPHEDATPESCGLSCRCANYVRTGCTGRPDALLRRLDAVCDREVRRMLVHAEKIQVSVASQCRGEKEME